MGQIKKDIKQLTKDAGGKTRARRNAEDWFFKSSKSIRENSVSNHARSFKTGMIHVFRYDKPKHMEKLPWWDSNPVVLALDPTEFGNDLGINLNLLPVAIKEDMLDMVYDRMKGEIQSQTKGKSSGNAKKQGQIKFTYEGAKKYLERFGLDFAIRQYIPQLKTNQKIVSYEYWAQIVLCDFIDLNGTTLGKIKYAFRNHLKK